MPYIFKIVEMTEEFKCSKCEKNHHFTFNYDFGLPKELVLKLFRDELSMERHENWMIVEEKYFFIRASIVMPVYTTQKTKSENYIWKTWILIDKECFDNYVYSHKINSQITGIGTLFLEHTYFDKAYGQKIRFESINNNSYPQVKFIDLESKIANASTNGVSREAAIEIIESILHS